MSKEVDVVFRNTRTHKVHTCEYNFRLEMESIPRMGEYIFIHGVPEMVVKQVTHIIGGNTVVELEEADPKAEWNEWDWRGVLNKIIGG